MAVNCPKCGRKLSETVGHGISQIVIEEVRYCLDCVCAPDPCEGCKVNNQIYERDCNGEKIRTSRAKLTKC